MTKGGRTFSPEYRLRCRRDYGLVRDRGRKRHTPHYIVIVMHRTCGPTRLGLTVSRKVGGAVVRNRVKRLLREFFRTRYEQLPHHADISIIAKKGASTLSFAELCEELHLLTGDTFN